MKAYYLKPQKFAYWEGCSTRGRQGYKMAQEHPEHYGYVVGAPAFNWTSFITNELYPQIVMQRDLGGAMTSDKLGFVSGAAVSACDVVGGQHLGAFRIPRNVATIRCAMLPCSVPARRVTARASARSAAQRALRQRRTACRYRLPANSSMHS